MRLDKENKKEKKRENGRSSSEFSPRRAGKKDLKMLNCNSKDKTREDKSKDNEIGKT